MNEKRIWVCTKTLLKSCFANSDNNLCFWDLSIFYFLKSYFLIAQLLLRMLVPGQHNKTLWCSDSRVSVICLAAKTGKDSSLDTSAFKVCGSCTPWYPWFSIDFLLLSAWRTLWSTLCADWQHETNTAAGRCSPPVVSSICNKVLQTLSVLVGDGLLCTDTGHEKG